MSERLQQTIGRELNEDTLQKLEALKASYDFDEMIAEKDTDITPEISPVTATETVSEIVAPHETAWPTTDELLMSEPGVAEALRQEKAEEDASLALLDQSLETAPAEPLLEAGEPEPLLKASNETVAPTGNWLDEIYNERAQANLGQQAVASHVADRPEPLHASSVHEEEAPEQLEEAAVEQPAEADPSHTADRYEPLHATTIHEETALDEESLQNPEQMRDAYYFELRDLVFQVAEAEDIDPESEEYKAQDAKLIELFKRCEQAGVRPKKLETLAKLLDATLPSVSETAKHVGEPGYKEDNIVEEIAEPTVGEKIKGWWNKSREALKGNFHKERWQKLWETPIEKTLEASVWVSYKVSEKLGDLRQAESDRLMQNMTPENVDAYRQKRRKYIMIGVGVLAVASPAFRDVSDLLTNNGVLDMAAAGHGSGIGDTLVNAHGHGVSHEALASASPLPTETGNAIEGIKLPDGVTAEQGPTTSHIVHEAISSGNLSSAQEFTPSNSTINHASEAFPSDSFKITSGEGGIQLFDKLGLHANDWNDAKGDLVNRFPNEFYNAGGDIRINHTGELPKAVQQYITNRFKG